MTTLEAVLQSSSPVELNYRSLSRAYELWQKSGTASFAILSAGDLDSTAGVGKSLKMQALVRDMGFGSVPLVVHFGDAVARVLFVLGIPVRLAERLRQRSGSDWFLFSGVETDGEVVRFTADGRVENLGSFTPARIAAVFATAGHEAFLEWRPSGFFEGLTATVLSRQGRLGQYPYQPAL